MDDVAVDVNAGDAERPEEIAFAAFVHTQAGQKQLRVEHCFVADARLTKHLGFEHELDELLRALALHHELAAFVVDDVGLLLARRKAGILHIVKLPASLLEQRPEFAAQFGVEFAGVGSQRLRHRQAV